MFLTVTSPRARSSRADNGHERHAARRRVLELLAQLVRFRVDLDAHSRAARRFARRAAARRRSRRRRRASPARRPPARRRRAGTCCARPSPRGCARARAKSRTPAISSPQNMPIKPIVAAAAAEAAGQIGNGDLHDRAGVVRQAARQARIERARAHARWSSPPGQISRRFGDAACADRVAGQCARPSALAGVGRDRRPRSNLERRAASSRAARAASTAARRQLRRTPSRTDLVELVQRDERRGRAGSAGRRRVQHRRAAARGDSAG